MTDHASEWVHCPWCKERIEIRAPHLVPEHPKAFKFPVPCCKDATPPREFLVTRYGGRLHVQRPSVWPPLPKAPGPAEA